MNKDLPIWVNVLRTILYPGALFGDWCSNLMVQLIDKYCRCELCKQDRRGGYRDRT